MEQRLPRVELSEDQLREAARLFGAKLVEFTNTGGPETHTITEAELDARVLDELVAA